MAITADETTYPSTAVGSHTFTPPSSPWTSGASYTANAQGVQRQNCNGPSTNTSTVTVTITKDETVVAYQAIISKPIVTPGWGLTYTFSNTTTSSGLSIDRIVLHRLSADASTSLEVIHDAVINTDTTAWSGTYSTTFGVTLPYTAMKPDDIYGIEIIWTNSGHGDLTHQFRILSIDFRGRAPYSDGTTDRNNRYDDVAIVDESGTVVAKRVYESGTETSTFPVTLKSNTQYYLRMTNIGQATSGSTNALNPEYAHKFDNEYRFKYDINDSGTHKYVGWGSDSKIYSTDPSGRYYHHYHHMTDDLEYRGSGNYQADGRCVAACHEDGEGIIFYHYMDSSTAPRTTYSYYKNYGETIIADYSPKLTALTGRTFLWDNQGAHGATTFDAWAVSPYVVNFGGTVQIWYVAVEVKETGAAYRQYTYVQNLGSTAGRIHACFRPTSTSTSVQYVVYNPGTGIQYGTITPSTPTSSSLTTINTDIPVRLYSIRGAGDDMHIVYQDNTTNDVKHIYWNGTSWATYTIEGSNSGTRYVMPMFDGTSLWCAVSRDSSDPEGSNFEPVFKFSGSSWSKSQDYGIKTIINSSTTQVQRINRWNNTTVLFSGTIPSGTSGTILSYVLNPDPCNYGPGVRMHYITSLISPGDTSTTYRWWGYKGGGESRNGDLMVAITANYQVQDYREIWFWRSGGNIDADIPSPKLVTPGNEFDNPYITNDYWGTFQLLNQRDSGSYNTLKELEIEFPFWIDGDKITTGDYVQFNLFTNSDTFTDGITPFNQSDVDIYRIGVVSITGQGDMDPVGDLWQGRLNINAGGAVTKFLEAKYLDSDEFEEPSGPYLDNTTTDSTRSWVFLNGDNFIQVLDDRAEFVEQNVQNSTVSFSGSATTWFFGNFN